MHHPTDRIIHTTAFALGVHARVHVCLIFVKLPFNLLFCFCSFEMSCPILVKYSFMGKLYIVISCYSVIF